MNLFYWLLIAIIVLPFLAFAFTRDEEDYWGMLGITVMFSVIIFFFSFMGALTAATDSNSDNRHIKIEKVSLQAISTETSGSGRSYFLGSGFYEGARQISYIAQKDGYSTIDAVDSDEARIYEDEETKPYLELVTYYTDISWVAPWVSTYESSDIDYRFHIPAGSIQEGYDISLNK